MKKIKYSKTYRVLSIFVKLYEGGYVNIFETAGQFQVDERTIHRDIAEIRFFLANQMAEDKCYGELVYDHANLRYYLKTQTSHI